MNNEEGARQREEKKSHARFRVRFVDRRDKSLKEKGRGKGTSNIYSIKQVQVPLIRYNLKKRFAGGREKKRKDSWDTASSRGIEVENTGGRNFHSKKVKIT